MKLEMLNISKTGNLIISSIEIAYFIDKIGIFSQRISLTYWNWRNAEHDTGIANRKNTEPGIYKAYLFYYLTN